MEHTPQTQLTPDFRAGEGLSVRRFFTIPGERPFDGVEWELRDARIGHGDKISFEQPEVEFPKSWSQNATNIVAQKYFRGQFGSPARERSVKQMIGRVAGTIASWGRERGYFATSEDADTFEAELTSTSCCTRWRLSIPRCGSTSESLPRRRPEDAGQRLLHPLG